MTWLSLVVPLPMLALSLHLDGPGSLAHALTHATWRELAAVLYLGAIATTLAYAVWGRLLHAYAAAQVAPFALLVPFVAALASSIVFGEEFGLLRLAGMACVLMGLTIIVLPRDRLRSMLVWAMAVFGRS